jgi:hypothetical protein
MATGKARLVIFALWLVAYMLCILALFLAVRVRRDLGFEWRDAFQMATPITSLYVPVLSAFALFWFRPGTRSSTRRLSLERTLPALGLTLCFQLIMAAGVIGIVLLSAPPRPDSNVTLPDQIAGLVHLMSILSPLATAPSAFLLGVEQIKVT